jgi:parallel beta-helix repeat protein
VVLLVVIGLFATRAFGGPLDPPGPPASTDGVRGPGTPIDHLPFTTTEGAYYYVTRSLSAAAGQSGLTICCSNTTVDLGGFTLFGAGAGMSPGDGIYNAGARNVVIKNGAVRGWSNGINLGGTYSRVEGVYATANLSDGIMVGGGSEVRDCVVSLNSGGGVYATGLARVLNCTFAENGGVSIEVGTSSLIEGNSVDNNNQGIYVTGANTTARDNELSGNSGTDITVSLNTSGNVIMNNVYCTITNNGANTVMSGNVDRTNC